MMFMKYSKNCYNIRRLFREVNQTMNCLISLSFPVVLNLVCVLWCLLAFVNNYALTPWRCNLDGFAAGDPHVHLEDGNVVVECVMAVHGVEGDFNDLMRCDVVVELLACSVL